MTTTQPQATVKQTQLFHGIVKQVNSGDSLIIRSQTVGKNLEKQIMLAQINSPRLGRNPKDAAVEPDQPYAFDAREFLRQKCVGKEVVFLKEATTTSGNDRGTLYLGKDVATGENINEAIIAAGLVEVRRLNKPNEDEARLVAIEEQAKSSCLGKWSKDSESDHVRNMKYSLENPKTFVDSLKQKPVDAIIEYVRDGSTLRCLLLPEMQNVTVQLSGVKCPVIKMDGEAEPFAEEAKHFVEARLLQKDVQIILEGVANQSNGILLGTVLHPNGNMSEFLLREGLARCVDWSMGVVTGGAEKYRTAEKQAKAAKIRQWKNYNPVNNPTDEANKNLSGKVVEVSNGDSVTIKINDTFKKLFLSSIRPPRQGDFPDYVPPKTDRKNNQLYDVPYLFEAREFLRKKLVGKKVNCTIDYVQPKQENYPEKVCATVMFGDINIAEALVSQGLVKVIRYKQDDDQRSSQYDDLLAAEARAQKKAAGVHSTKQPTSMKINDTSNDSNKTKQLLPFFQRLGRIDAICEYVASGSRLRLYLPKETCLITCLLSGIECPRLGRPAMNNMPASNSDEFAEDAFQYTKSRTFQHEVKVEIEGVDKAGNFIGYIFTEDHTNIAVGLVEAGFAGVHKTAYNSSYYAALDSAQTRAKDKKLNRWKNFVDQEVTHQEVQKNEPTERVVAQKKIVITEVTSDLHFFGQLIENGPKLEQLMGQLHTEIETRPPTQGAYTPKVNDVCVAQFSMDDEWYRAKVVSCKSNGDCTVLFIDYGNKELTKTTKLAQIPAGFEVLPAQAHEYALAMVQLSSDEDDNENAIDYLKDVLELGNEPEFSINVEYKVGNVDYVTLTDTHKVDIGKKLVSDGFVSVDRARREKRLQKLLTDYLKTLTAAKSSHRNMWRYGDKEQDDAAEFGVSKK
jgi:staphylococcal nuclease domain-containing protein 1